VLRYTHPDRAVSRDSVDFAGRVPMSVQFRQGHNDQDKDEDDDLWTLAAAPGSPGTLPLTFLY